MTELFIFSFFFVVKKDFFNIKKQFSLETNFHFNKQLFYNFFLHLLNIGKFQI